jgi:UDP-glucose 4-epimerase
MRKVQNTNVCVIGGAGFIGSHLVDYLIEEKNCNVIVLDNLITGQTKNINPKAKFIWHDIRDNENELTRILKNNNVEYVFNYAAEPYIPECFERPMHFFDINATSVLRVLNACQNANIKGLLQVSSAEIYGDMKGKITEKDPVEPHSTYGVSKLAADGLVQVRWKEAKVPAIAMRQFNCVGERETHEYVIPEIICPFNVFNDPFNI